MGVKVRQIRGRWYVVIDYRGRRKSKLLGSEKRAREVAEQLEMALEMYGLAALDAFTKGRERALPKIPSFKSYAEKWSAEIERSDRKPATITSYQGIIRTHLIPAFGPKRLDEIDYAALKAFALEKAKGRSRDTVRLMIATLRLILAEAVREGILQSNPVQGLARYYRAAHRRKDKIDPFTTGELDKILKAAELRFAHDYHPFILTLSRTGIRIGEAIGLQWRDVDVAADQLLIRRTMGRTGETGSPKTRSGERRVDLHGLGPELQTMRRRRLGRYLAEGETEIPEWVFLSAEGHPIRYTNFLNRVWTRVLANAGVRYRTPHDLRHTWASLMLSAGEDLAYVSAQLGHRHPGITLAVYTHCIPGKKRVTGVFGKEGAK